jgi:sulfur relay protein, tusE/dsrC/dsvC family
MKIYLNFNFKFFNALLPRGKAHDHTYFFNTQPKSLLLFQIFIILQINLKPINIMATLEIHGKTFEVDGDGFLTDPSIWNEDVAKLFAEADGITELNDKHWAIIKIIRDNFEEKGNAPMVRTICKETGLKLKDIYELFPLGPARGACRVAGLPKPDGCV